MRIYGKQNLLTFVIFKIQPLDFSTSIQLCVQISGQRTLSTKFYTH